MGYRWCPECQRQVQPVPEPACEGCGLPISHAGRCFSCSRSSTSLQSMRSWLIYEGPIRQAIHSLKFRRNVALGDALAIHLAKFVDSLNWPVETIVAVPAGKKRLAERGYNQVNLIAKPLASILKKQYSSKILARARETRTQVGLSPVERKENVAGAFQANLSLAAGRSILVVDDVATTGATLAACAEALKSAGASRVYALTVARALPHHGFLIV